MGWIKEKYWKKEAVVVDDDQNEFHQVGGDGVYGLQQGEI